MIQDDLSRTILIEPLKEGYDELKILSAYATPTMLSWFVKNIYHKAQVPISIQVIVGMVPFDGLSVSVHEGFNQLVTSQLPNEIKSLKCSYVYEMPPYHSNLYIWAKDGKAEIAFMGSACFVQSSFIGNSRKELMAKCDPASAIQVFEEAEGRSIYCNHGEVEEYVVLRPSHPVLDLESNLIESTNDLDSVTLSLLTRDGVPGRRSGLNWGQRKGREPNQAYIHLPSKIAQTGFFPLEKQHFTAITDDRHQLTLRVEQQNNKAITTPVRNSDLGEYFRNRLGLPNGAYVNLSDLERYGRTDVKFIKLDDETFYMDFSV